MRNLLNWAIFDYWAIPPFLKGECKQVRMLSLSKGEFGHPAANF